MLVRSFVTQSCLTKLIGGGKMKKQKSDKLDKRRSDKMNPISYSSNSSNMNSSLSLTYFGGL